MRLLKLMTLVAVILNVCSVAAQNPTPNPKRAQIWYFGINAGLDFTNGNPVAITDGAMQAHEGITVACDASGNLQFYSNGGDLPNTGAVWNRNHQVMPNGYLGHSGCASSIQAALAVNLPGSSNIYYLFTTDCYENGLENGMTYSIIDMNLDGGLGDVVQKGISLTRNTTESVAAVAHPNGKEYWIITHKVDTDSFYVYNLTREGITGVVKTKIGPVADNAAGEIRVSSNGQRLVFAANFTPTGLYDFDPTTGQISNYRDLDVPGGFTACFSPNCELLYVSHFVGQKIYQFDLYASNVPASKTLIGSPGNYIGSMQIGPDDKIYAAVRNSATLAVITRPNIKGADCNFVENGQTLGGKASKYGLPNYPTNVLGECVPYPAENQDKFEFFLRWEDIRPSNATVYFTNYRGASEYRIDYRKAEGKEWETVSATSNIRRIDGLNENTEYEIRMNKIIFENGEYEFLYHHNFRDVVSNAAPAESSAALKIKTPESLSFSAYPVPARESVTVEINFDEPTDAVVFVTDLSGKTVYTRHLENAEGLKKFEIPTLELPNGSYQLSVRSSGRSENRKLVIMN